MVKQPTAEQTEFQMSSEDFPALPGTQITDGLMTSSGSSTVAHQITGVNLNHNLSGNSTTNANGNGNNGGHESGSMVGLDTKSLHSNHMSGASGVVSVAGVDIQTESMSARDKQRGVQTHPDGKVTNIPNSMINNQFGMVGLLTFIRAAESDPNLVTLAMGEDLTALGLNLNSQDNLYPNFGGPFVDQPCRPQDIDFHVPPEYLVNLSIREKLSGLTLKKYKDDLLFFLFYTSVGDVMQLAAAAEL